MMGIYAVTTLVFTFFFLHPTIGLANTTVSSSRMIGWLWYFFVESYGSVIIASFWVIVTVQIQVASATKPTNFTI